MVGIARNSYSCCKSCVNVDLLNLAAEKFTDIFGGQQLSRIATLDPVKLESRFAFATFINIIKGLGVTHGGSVVHHHLLALE